MPVNILLVEDNPADARLLREAFSELTSYNVELTHVESMRRAEEHVAKHAVDLMVLDLGLPDVQGLEAVRRARLAAPHVPLVVLTGLDSEAFAVRVLRQGAHDYLVKGQIEPRGLLRALHLAVEREAHQREMGEQKRELERSNADLEQFAFAASHDMKAPLRGIENLVRWIDEDIGATASPGTMGNLKLLGGRVARLQKLLDGLLAYARVGRSDTVTEDVDIAEEIQVVKDMLELPPGFVVVGEGEMPVIRTWRVPLQMILKNLISNALQHHDRSEGRIAVSMRFVDGMGEFRVSDDGPGIAAKDHDRIFAIFQTLRSSDQPETSGIGLAMVKKQVSENGGRIWIESAPPDRGATFVFTWK